MKWSKSEFKKLRNGDPEAFEALYLEYKDNIYNFLYMKTNKNIDITEELFSETFYSAMKSISSLKNAKNIQGWLYTIASRKFNDHLRKLYQDKRRDERIKTDDLYEKDSINDLLEEEKLACLDIAMDNIKPKYKEILTLKYLLGKSQKEISQKLKKSISAIEGLLFRARESLKKELKKSSNIFEEE